MIMHAHHIRKLSVSGILAITFFIGTAFIPMEGGPHKKYPTPDTESVEAQIRQITKDHETVNLQVAVVKGNEIIYTHSFGWKDKETETPLSDSDIFRIASISKSFSSTAIMQLVEAGKVSLDADVSDLIGFQVRNPNFPDIPITLRMLLSHTSSLNDSQKYSSLDIINPDKNPKWKNSYSDYAPGKGYKYCNLNYNTIGAIIERITGQRFDLYIKQHILDPLGLYGGHCTDLLNQDLFAQIYRFDAETGEHIKSLASYKPLGDKLKSYRIGYDAPMLSPTGNMKINATDLAKYLIMHKNQGVYHGVRILSEASAKQMQAQAVEIKPDSYYGFALGTYDDFAAIPGKRIQGHGGSMYGMRSGMYFNREDDFGIVIIGSGSNKDYLSMQGFRGKVINALYRRFIK